MSAYHIIEMCILKSRYQCTTMLYVNFYTTWCVQIMAGWPHCDLTVSNLLRFRFGGNARTFLYIGWLKIIKKYFICVISLSEIYFLCVYLWGCFRVLLGVYFSSGTPCHCKVKGKLIDSSLVDTKSQFPILVSRDKTLIGHRVQIKVFKEEISMCRGCDRNVPKFNLIYK